MKNFMLFCKKIFWQVLYSNRSIFAKSSVYNRVILAFEDIEQMAGQALGYPWYKDDQKNFPGATESDGVCVGEHVPETIVQELASKYVDLDKKLKIALGLLSACEWSMVMMGECPVCVEEHRDGHDENCLLAKFLKDNVI